MRFALVIAAALALAACAPEPPVAEKPDRPLNPTEACAAKGGTYRRVCLMGDWTCVMPHKDAGKRCSDGDECESKQCRYVGASAPQPGQQATGECRRTSDPCGCFTLVEDGKAEPTLCVD